MSDLNIEYYWVCQDLDYFVRRIKSSDGKTEYNVCYHRGEWDCSCQGFRFKLKCKHIDQAMKEQCTWNQFVHGGEPVIAENGTEKIAVCPECGRPCISVKMAV